MRTSRKTNFLFRLKLFITIVESTYPKAWTGSLPLCPSFSLDKNHSQTKIEELEEKKIIKYI